MKLNFSSFSLEFKHVFSVSGNTRSNTPIVFTEIEYDGLKGYGEASMPPYLGETSKSVQDFLSKVDLSIFSSPLDIETIMLHVDSIAMGNTAAKAAVDIALHDLIGKIKGIPLYQYWNLNPEETPYTSFTIGIDTPEMIMEKVKETKKFKFLKVKLGAENDKEIISTIRKVTNKPLYVDINQGWKDRIKALEMIYWLKENGTVLVEQPMPKEQIDDLAWLTSNSPIPIVADESIRRLSDLQMLSGAFSGINIKLMKSTGLLEARKMIKYARKHNLLVMIGCMSESSCAVTAASHLSPLVDFADLDSPLLISNDQFEGIKYINGKIKLPTTAGIGITPINVHIGDR